MKRLKGWMIARPLFGVDFVYNPGKLRFMTGDGTNGWDLAEADDDMQVALTASGYTPNIDTHDFFDDVTNELSGTGYTAGGEDLAVQTAAEDDTDDEAVFDANDLTWSGLDAGTIDALVIYHNTAGAASTDPLLAYIDTATNLPLVTNGGDVTIAWAAEGILNLT